jgi:hypothetical protein
MRSVGGCASAIEEVFGWTKATAGFRKTRHRGLGRVGWMFPLTANAYNLVRLSKLVAAVAQSRSDSAQILPSDRKNHQNRCGNRFQ